MTPRIDLRSYEMIIREFSLKEKQEIHIYSEDLENFRKYELVDALQEFGAKLPKVLAYDAIQRFNESRYVSAVEELGRNPVNTDYVSTKSAKKLEVEALKTWSLAREVQALFQ